MRTIIAWAGVDEKCDCCERPAVWRARNRAGDIVGAACAEHKEARRVAVYQAQANQALRQGIKSLEAGKAAL